jgi:hypothetical protein
MEGSACTKGTKLDHAKIAEERHGQLGDLLYDGGRGGDGAQGLSRVVEEVEDHFGTPAFGDNDRLRGPTAFRGRGQP